MKKQIFIIALVIIISAFGGFIYGLSSAGDRVAFINAEQNLDHMNLHAMLLMSIKKEAHDATLKISENFVEVDMKNLPTIEQSLSSIAATDESKELDIQLKILNVRSKYKDLKDL